MTKLVSRFRLDSASGSSRNIWLALALVFALMMLNFRTLLIPRWAISMLAMLFFFLQMVSLIFYGYWTAKNWNTFTQDKRLTTALYSGLLILTTLLTCNFVWRMI